MQDPELVWFGVMAVLAMGGTAAAVPALALVAPRLGLIDLPGGRKRHGRPVPLTGGLSLVVVAFAVSVPASLLLTGQCHWPVVFAALALLACGVVDDARDVRWTRKGLCELAIVGALVFAGPVQIHSLGALFGGGAVALGPFAAPFTVLVLLGYINALNMLDGLDGLAGGVACVALGLLAAVAALAGDLPVLILTTVFGSSTLGFLAWNMRLPWRRRAVVFLGDSGVHVLGLVVGAAAILLAGPGAHRELAPMSAAWILALPVMDTLVVIGRRLAAGASPFVADRSHIHHVLVDLGLVHGTATAVLVAVSALYGFAGILIRLYLDAHAWQMAGVFILMLLVHAGFVTMAQTRIRRSEEDGFATEDAAQ